MKSEVFVLSKLKRWILSIKFMVVEGVSGQMKDEWKDCVGRRTTSSSYLWANWRKKKLWREYCDQIDLIQSVQRFKQPEINTNCSAFIDNLFRDPRFAQRFFARQIFQQIFTQNFDGVLMGVHKLWDLRRQPVVDSCWLGSSRCTYMTENICYDPTICMRSVWRRSLSNREKCLAW